MYSACRDAKIHQSIASRDSPVGSGKTTAIMAHLLSQAQARGLRRIFVVLPFTNIISQSVEVYRTALTLPGEHPEEVVAELHHRTEFEHEEARHLTALWRAPIIVTTAVAFFETLAANTPAQLADWVTASPGPRLLILNTVQNAAVMAEYMAARFGGGQVEHLSSALTPAHRALTLARVRERLRDRGDTDWTSEKITLGGLSQKSTALLRDERLHRFPRVAENFRVIDFNTRVCVADSALAHKLRLGGCGLGQAPAKFRSNRGISLRGPARP